MEGMGFLEAMGAVHTTLTDVTAPFKGCLRNNSPVAG